MMYEIKIKFGWKVFRMVESDQAIRKKKQEWIFLALYLQMRI